MGRITSAAGSKLLDNLSFFFYSNLIYLHVTLLCAGLSSFVSLHHNSSWCCSLESDVTNKTKDVKDWLCQMLHKFKYFKKILFHMQHVFYYYYCFCFVLSWIKNTLSLSCLVQTVSECFIKCSLCLVEERNKRFVEKFLCVLCNL